MARYIVIHHVIGNEGDLITGVFRALAIGKSEPVQKSYGSMR
jgi:hypothetical protein